MLPAAAATAAVVGLLGFLLAACSNIEAALGREVVGQHQVTQQLVEAICHHLARSPQQQQQQQQQLAASHPQQPLVISAHGPPGVGKTFTHRLLARALYNANYTQALRCPGPHCSGYKVYYGMDYLAAETGERLAQVASSLRQHLATTRDTLVVVEEYDKLDCAARGLWRQLLQNPEVHGLRWERSIVLLESNLGMAEISNASMAAAAAGGQQLSPEAWQSLLRDLVFTRWRAQGCEGYEDTLKMISLVDFWLPYLPLGRPALEALLARGLVARGAQLLAGKGLELSWGQAVVPFLMGKVEMDGEVALDGAKSVESVLTRHINRLLRTAPAAPRQGKQHSVLQLQVDAGGQQLVAHVDGQPLAST